MQFILNLFKPSLNYNIVESPRFGCWIVTNLNTGEYFCRPSEKSAQSFVADAFISAGVR